MTRNRFRTFLFVGLLFTLLSTLASSTVRADELLPIIPSSSVLNIGVQLGTFVDDQGNALYPSGQYAGQPYGPGSVNPVDNTPVTWTTLATAVGEGSSSVPAGIFPGGIGDVAGGIVPGFSDGTSAQVVGTADISSGNLTLTLGLENSGLWQPGLPYDGLNYTSGLPTPAAIAEYVDASGTLPGEWGLAVLAAQSPAYAADEFTMKDNAFALSHGAFSFNNVPYSQQGLYTYGIINGPFPGTFDLTIGNPTTASGAGTFTSTAHGDSLGLSLHSIIYDIATPELPGLYVQLNINGNVVASNVVPEPSSLVLATIGLLALLPLARHRLRRK